MSVSSAAQQAEVNASQKLQKALGGEQNAPFFVKPAGFSTEFPDFGLVLQYERQPLYLHIEYKADSKAQMGSMRDWIFDGEKFTSPKLDDVDKKELLDIMNSNQDCVKNGKKLLELFKKYYDSKVTKIYSGVLTVESDIKLRRPKLLSFISNLKPDTYQLANIKDNDSLGDKLLKVYKNKFNKVKKSGGPNICYMMIGNELFLVDSSGATDAHHKYVADLLGHRSIPQLKDLRASLEVRIQPRGLSGPSKPVSIDVMASFRLAGKGLVGAAVK
jgi:hypothetical protein